jgi:hypothetical protein
LSRDGTYRFLVDDLVEQSRVAPRGQFGGSEVADLRAATTGECVAAPACLSGGCRRRTSSQSVQLFGQEAADREV